MIDKGNAANYSPIGRRAVLRALAEAKSQIFSFVIFGRERNNIDLRDMEWVEK